MTSSVGFVFPGQGSQQVGMLAEIERSSPIIRETFAQASESLGYDLWKIVTEGPENELNKTEITQPALLTASVALWRLWEQSSKLKPKFLAGHSLGEYSALVCAGALEFDAAVKLVRLRGQFMQEAVPSGTGAMAAILGMDNEHVENVCQAVAGAEVVSPVNYNCPGQLVIAGHVAAVERAIEACKIAGAKRAIMLSVSVPSHCILMQPAAERLAEVLDSVVLTPPNIPVIHNVSAELAGDVAAIRQHLIEQLFSPVQWTSTLRKMVAEGVTITLECGPGKVLSGLNKKIDKTLTVVSLGDSAGFEKALSLQ